MKRILLSTFVLLACALNARGQFSTYSSYGFGISAPWQTVRSIGQGYTGSASADSITLNKHNPALWTGFQGTSIQGQFFFASLQAPRQAYQTNFGRFSGVAFKFPIGKRVGVALGVNPLTRTDAARNFQDTTRFEGSTITTQSDLYLTGGLSEFFFGGGLRLTPYLSLGAKLRIITGNYLINYNTVIKGPNTIYSYWEANTSVSGKTVQLGALWEIPRTQSRLAVTYDQPLDCRYLKAINYSYGADSTSPQRQLRYPTSLQLALSQRLLPQLTLNLEWQAAFADPDLFREFYLFTPSEWRNPNLLGIGLEFTPHLPKEPFNAPGAAYRLGFYRRTEPIYLDGQQVVEQGITLGWAIPVFNYLNRLDFALTYGLRHGFAGDEQCVTFYCGLSTGELWFLKSKRR